jgi:GntR family transcriptional regulator
MVSVITVKRAYEELERERIVYRRQGLGTFVSETGQDRNREARQAEAAQLFQAAIASARQAGLSDREIVSLVRESLANLSDQPNL